MCGIVGLLKWHDTAEGHRGTVANMLAHIRHRGPDEMGCFFDDSVALGAARLQIIDRVGGRQPVSDAAERHWIVYNGEVYNYVELRDQLESLGRTFASRSDTEVVLQAWLQWGEKALERLDGAFAFAIYDRVARSLILARDRFGERPLFYAVKGSRLAFASEMKSLLAVPGFAFEFDAEQLASIYSTWTPLPDQSGFRDVAQVPPGAALLVEPDGVKIRRYTNLDLDPEPFSGSLEEAAERTRELLTRSVRLRLRSDVEVGTYLSGGLDSSIVTALAVAQAGDNVRTFALSFDDPAFDESSAQRQVSEALGTRHTAVEVNGRDIAERFPEAVWHAEVPVFRTAFVPMLMLSRAVRGAGVKVVLTGEGADEGFLGYNIFKEALLRSNWADGAGRAEKIDAIARLYPYLPHVQEHARALLPLFERFSRVEDPRYVSHALRFHNAGFASRLLRERKASLGALDRLIEAEAPDLGSHAVIARAQWLEFKTLLAGYLLSTQGDRMSLANGVEGRCPFLAPEVVSWAASLPIEYRLRNGTQEKHILKAAFADLLPSEILDRPKQPYRAPDAEAFIRCQPDYLESVLAQAEIADIDVLDASFGSRLATKVLRSDPSRVSPRESQAFLFLLSTALLHRFFCRRLFDSPPPIGDLLVKCVDGRRI